MTHDPGAEPATDRDSDLSTPAVRAPRALRKLADGTRSQADAHHVRDVLVATVMQLVVALRLERAGWLDALARGGAPALLVSKIGAGPAGPGGRWAAARRLFELLHEGWEECGERRVFPFPGGLFEATEVPVAIDDDAIAGALAELQQTDAGPDAGANEQIAEAYEALTEWGLVRSRSLSMAPREGEQLIDLEALLREHGEARCKLASELLGRTLPGGVARAVSAASTADLLAAALRRYASLVAPCPIQADTYVMIPSLLRRRSGAHYTSRALTRLVVQQTLRPLLAERDIVAEPLLWTTLRVCDPAMGTGAFLLEAGRQWVDVLCAGRADDDGARRRAWAFVLRRCLHGVDTDQLAVQLARACLTLEASTPGRPFLAAQALHHGDALIGLARVQAAPSIPGYARDRASADASVASFLAGGNAAKRRTRTPASDERNEVDGRETTELPDAEPVRPFHWDLEFPEVMGGGGFDAMVGNPPWVAFAGRAAQPLDRARFSWFETLYPSFRGYRTLHGLFLERCARLLRPGGRLGLIVPTSVADLQGYLPARQAHDALCEPDDELPDLGSDAFSGVFQPAMVVLSTRRAAPGEPTAGPVSVWPLSRSDADPQELGLLERIVTLTPVPAEMFSERGYQSAREDASKFVARCSSPRMTPIREGADLTPFHAHPPRLFVDPQALSGRMRSAEQWREVDVLVRQTARYPIAACGDGVPFRNSILAGFARGLWTPHALAAYLNSWPVRWLHYMRFRDARQGMPQVKIAHLRAIPDLPPSLSAAFEALHRIGEGLSRRRGELESSDQAALDQTVASAWNLTALDEQLIAAFSVKHPVPVHAVPRSL